MGHMNVQQRVMLSLVVLLGIISTPWWVYTSVILALLITVPDYFESLFFAFIIILLYRLGRHGVYVFAATFALYLFINYVRRRIRH